MSVVLLSLLILIPVYLYWRIIPAGGRSFFLLICSLIFISIFNIFYAAFFLFITAIVYYAGKEIERNKQQKKIIFNVTLSFLIGSLLVHKYLFKLNPQTFFAPLFDIKNILWPLGISYITFRLIHYLIEVYRKKTPPSSFIDFALYVLFFPTFLAGPVERFPKFHYQIKEKKEFKIIDINYSLYRIICGMMKKFFIADNLIRLVIPVLNNPQEYNRAIVILSVYGWAIGFYADFSGYTDMAIGIARLFGFNIMENFKKPFFKKNIALFWRNWHISVYYWIRDYFFLPIFGHHASKARIYIGIFTTMLVFHLWHGFSMNFLFMGLYHGLGLAIWHFFQEFKKKYFFFYRSKLIRYLNPISIFFTFSFVSFSFIFIIQDIYGVINICKRIF